MKYLSTPFSNPYYLLRLFLGISLIVAAITTDLIAQADMASVQVKELFDKPKRIKWIRHYTGKLDQVNDVSMSIGYDGKRCKGRLVYAGSQELFLLEGNLSGNKLSLKEKDKNDQTSGFLTGSLSEHHFTGTWRNQSKDLSLPLRLNIAEAPLKVPLPCTADRWIRTYRSDAHQLLIQNLGEQQFTGYIHLPGRAGTFHFDSEKATSNGQVLFELLDLYGKQVGFLQSKEQQGPQWNFIFIDPQGKSQEVQFQLEEQFAMNCTSYADYLSSYDITFPQTTSNEFNQWISQQAKVWIQRCQDYTSVVGAEETNYRPEMRAALRAYAWTDICFYDQQLISGQISEQKSWSNETNGQSFIYDFRAQRVLEESDIFNPAFPRRAFLWEKLKTELPNFPLYIDKNFRQWMENNEFPYLSLSMEGLCFSTEFDMIYGQQHLIIPYAEILPYLKKDSPVAVIARKQ